MGQFSWISVDTEEQIYNDQAKGFQTVTMVYKDETGTIKRVVEDNYEGYGEFGGVDFYDAMVWMNPQYNPEDNDFGQLRSKGIELYFKAEKEPVGFAVEYPQLYLGTPPERVDFTLRPDDDPNQGWMMEDDEDEWDDEDDDASDEY